VGICRVTADEIQKYMPCSVLTLGAQENIELVDLKGGSLVSVDIKAHQGTERVADLNYPSDLGTYDLVVDCGTVEHCSNIFNAIKNAADAVKVGGRILHHSPVSMLNHGYFNICPVFYRDYYRLNGWTIERFDLMNMSDEVAKVKMDICARNLTIAEWLVLVVALRPEGATTDRLPLQGEFQ